MSDPNAEALVGRAIRGRRHEMVLASNFGHERRADGSFAGLNVRPSYVRGAFDASSRRLGVDTLNLDEQHQVDTVGAMAQLVQAGKVRFWGLSEAS